MAKNIINKTVLITGGAKRIGAHISEFLHGTGMNVIIHYRNSASSAKKLKSKLNKKRVNSAEILQADLLDKDSLSPLIENSVKIFGRLDCLINNASSYYPTPLLKINEDSWEELMGSNLKAPLFLSKFAAPYLKEVNGSIINITDTHIKSPKKSYIIYSIAKSGLVTLTHSLAQELAPEVRVNAVAPGPILWPDDKNEFSDMYKAKVVKETLLKKTGDPSNISEAVYFLIAKGLYTTGHVLEVDGGRSFSL
jgi:pteridine reductase